MKIKELRDKSDVELLRLLAEQRSKFQDDRFAALSRNLTRVRELRSARKDIAQILTIRNERNQRSGQENVAPDSVNKSEV